MIPNITGRLRRKECVPSCIIERWTSGNSSKIQFLIHYFLNWYHLIDLKIGGWKLEPKSIDIALMSEFKFQIKFTEISVSEFTKIICVYIYFTNY
jgi:hypothetical protein